MTNRPKRFKVVPRGESREDVSLLRANIQKLEAENARLRKLVKSQEKQLEKLAEEAGYEVIEDDEDEAEEEEYEEE